MNILIIGSGGREHALAWKIAQSPLVDTIWSAPGSPALDQLGPCFDVQPDDIEKMEQLVLQIEPDLIVIGPEVPLALGAAPVFGSSAGIGSNAVVKQVVVSGRGRGRAGG